MAAHGVGVALGLAVVVVGERGLGHEGAQARVVGGIGEVGELLGTDRQLAPQLPQPLGRPG